MLFRNGQAILFAAALVICSSTVFGLPNDVLIVVHVTDAASGRAINNAWVSWKTLNVPGGEGTWGFGWTDSSGLFLFRPLFGSGFAYEITTIVQNYEWQEMTVVPSAIPAEQHYTFDLNRVDGTPKVDAGPDLTFHAYDLRTDSMWIEITWHDPDYPLDEGDVSVRKLSGPGHVAIRTGLALGWETRFNFDAFGLYEFEFSYQDNYGDVGSDTLLVNVMSGAPIVDAGFDRGIQGDSLPVLHVLHGTVTDPDDGPWPLVSKWRLVSGPGNAIFTDDNQPSTYVRFTATGTYILELSADDGRAQAFDEIEIDISLGGSPPPGSGSPGNTVPGQNVDPTVDAGADMEVLCESFPCRISLEGTANDPDNGPSALVTRWRVLGSSGDVILDDDTDPGTSATFSAPGVYTLELSADDGQSQVVAEVEISIELDSSTPPGTGNSGNTVPGQNVGPTVYAGADVYVFSYTLPCRVSLQGTAEDPDNGPSALVSQWRIISSSGDVSFDDDTDPGTSATFSQAGVYTIELHADDGGTQVSDQVEITIATNQNQTPPITGDELTDMVGHWKLDGNLDDEIGSADGTFLGGTPAYGSGMVDRSLQFDGIDDYLKLPVFRSPAAYTIAAWVKPARTNASSIIARTNASGTPIAWSHQLRLNGFRVFEHYAWDGSPRTVTGTTMIEAGTWYFVTITATSGGNMRLYVNGREEGNASTVDTLWPDGDRYNVGSNSGDGMGWFEGMVDEIRIYDRMLSEIEILSVMRGEPWPYAWNPDPADGAVLESTWMDLTWSPGAHAASHDIYLSDNFDDVNNGTTIAFQGNLNTTSLTAGLAGFAFPDGLVRGTTYYWRVDEVNDVDPDSPWKGDVWSFTVLPEIEITDPNLIGLWNFDEGTGTTAFDWSGHGNHGVLRNRPQWVLEGHDGGALQFDGRDDYISGLLDVSETEYSSAMWFRTTNPDCGLISVVQSDLGSGGHDRHIYLSDGSLKARIWNNETIATELNVADGLWHHVVHTYGVSIGGQELYVDGVLQASGVKSQSDFDWQQRINIGFSNDAAQTHFEGMIDEVNIFDKALTKSEIDAFFKL